MYVISIAELSPASQGTGKMMDASDNPEDYCIYLLLLFFNPHLRTSLLILERGEGRERYAGGGGGRKRKRERETSM